MMTPGQAPQLMIPLFWSTSTKAGDTLTNPTTEQFFASLGAMPANWLAVGDRFCIEIAGRYMIPGSVGPTCNPKVYLGSAVLATTGNVSVGVGTGVSHPFSGRYAGVVRSVGASGSIYGSAQFSFGTNEGTTPAASTEIIDSGLVTINTTIAQNVASSVIASNVANQTFTLTDIFGYKFAAMAGNS